MSSLNTNLDDVYYTTDFRQIYNELLHFFTVKQYCRTMLLLFFNIVLRIFMLFSCLLHEFRLNKRKLT